MINRSHRKLRTHNQWPVAMAVWRCQITHTQTIITLRRLRICRMACRHLHMDTRIQLPICRRRSNPRHHRCTSLPTHCPMPDRLLRRQPRHTITILIQKWIKRRPLLRLRHRLRNYRAIHQLAMVTRAAAALHIRWLICALKILSMRLFRSIPWRPLYHPAIQ